MKMKRNRSKAALMLEHLTYRYRLVRQINLNKADNIVQQQAKDKYLYVSPVGEAGKDFLAKIISRFGHEKFDYLIFAFDDTPFNEPVFERCRIVREKGRRWYFMKNYVTPEKCATYSHIFAWPDDIDVENFSYQRFIEIMYANRLQVAQPALTKESFGSHAVLVERQHAVGRFVDFIEIMVPVFTREAWSTFYQYIDAENNPCGWGMDELAMSLCNYTNLGVIDSEAVTHTRPVHKANSEVKNGWIWFKEKHSNHKPALKITLKKLATP